MAACMVLLVSDHDLKILWCTISISTADKTSCNLRLEAFFGFWAVCGLVIGLVGSGGLRMRTDEDT